MTAVRVDPTTFLAFKIPASDARLVCFLVKHIHIIASAAPESETHKTMKKKYRKTLAIPIFVAFKSPASDARLVRFLVKHIHIIASGAPESETYKTMKK